MTLDDLKDYIKGHLDSYGEGCISEGELPESFKCIESDQWTQDGKYQHSTDIYDDGEGNFYAVHNSRSGSYRTDWYYGTPEVNAVKKVTKTIVVDEWEAI